MHTSGYRGATAARSVPETAVRGSGGAVSASIRRRRAMGVIGRLIRTPHRRCDDAPAPATRVARRAGSRATAPEAVAAGQHVAPQGDEPRGVVAEAARLERECAAIIRGRVRLARADEAAPPARGAEERSGEAGAPSERL